MALTQLNIDHVRNLSRVRLRELQQVNVFHGRNGSGKTSVLESIHLLGMARSFRGNSIRSLITHEQETCTVFGLVTDDALGGSQSIGVQRSRGGETQIRVGGSTIKVLAELAECLPLQVITADSFNLLTGPPGGRRQFLDWGVFHVEHRFFAQWQKFQRCLKQRNMLLRRGKLSDQELAVWTRDLVSAGTMIHEFRESCFVQLAPRFNAILGRLAPSLDDVSLQYRRGWDRQLGYDEVLQQSIATDIEQGYTHSGPQRADVRVFAGKHLAAETLSRGQQKLVVCALKLAQGQLKSELGGGNCTYLIDDLPSELDAEHSRQVCSLLAQLGAQVFITCVDPEEIQSVWPEGGTLGMFHVEHGGVTAENAASPGSSRG